jgi:signal transduction histidine kinase
MPTFLKTVEKRWERWNRLARVGLRMYLTAPLIPSPVTRQLPEISHLCQLQLQQLALQIPVLQAQIVYWDSSARQVITLKEEFCELAGQLSESQKALIHTDDFSTQLAALPSQVLTVIETRSASPSPQGSPQGIASVCRWGSKDFLLLWTPEQLSPPQQQCVEGQVLLLQHFLAMHQEHLRQQAEIRLLEQILQRAEHQLRNPLALISLYAENLYLGLSAAEQKQQVALIRETTAQLTESVSNLLACGQPLRLAPCNVREVLQEAAAGLQPWIREKQIKVSLPSSSLNLTADRWQIQQVFHNLLHNAIHFSPKNGVITCDWQVSQQEVVMSIVDQGSGIAESDLSQIFTPFYSRRPGGTGLGLAIAQKIILDHHGSLGAKNLPDGAQFSIRLPILKSGSSERVFEKP